MTTTALAAPAADAGLLATLSAEQRTELDAIVRDINEAELLGNLSKAKRIGSIVVDRFFGGSVQTFQDQHKKHPTYRALAEHPDLVVSFTGLWYAVAVHYHFGSIGEETANALTLAHHRVLAHVPEPAARATYATQAVKDGLTAEQLQALIRQAAPAPDPDQPKRGRPRVPEIVKGLAKAGKTLKDLSATENLTKDERVRAAREARKVADLATELAQGLEACES